jgi:hypothetical protein
MPMRSFVREALGLALAAACGGTSSPTGNQNPGNTGGGAKVTLTITVSGQGSVTAPAQSFACAGTCAQPLAAGTAVQLAAMPAAGMLFTGWSGACSGTGVCTLTLAQDTQVGAAFAPAPPASVLLTVHRVGEGDGRVVSSPAGIDCPGNCAMSVAAGTAVTLSSNATATSQFEGFGGGCSGLTCAFTASADLVVYAKFSRLAPAPADPCAGLMPKVPPAKTFVSPGNRIDGSCGGTSTDGLGTVYNFDNRNGGGIDSNAGGAVGGRNLIFLLASGFSAFTRSMVATGQFSVYAPDGTWLSATGWYRPFATGEQANGGSIILSENPAVGVEIVRFDDRFAKTSAHLLNAPFTPDYDHAVAILVDAQDRTLIVYVGGQGDVLGIPAAHYGARWFDADGKPLTDWFDAGAAGKVFYFALTPLIGGGVALAEGSGDWVTIPSGAARVGPSPAGFVSGKGTRIVLGGRAYAMMGPGVGTIDIVEPGGKSCGALPIGSDYYSIGKDGTVLTLVNTVGASGRRDTCTTTYYPQVLK